MTKYVNPSFSVAVGSKQYRDGWDAVFGRKRKEPSESDTHRCEVCGETADDRYDYMDTKCSTNGREYAYHKWVKTNGQ